MIEKIQSVLTENESIKYHLSLSESDMNQLGFAVLRNPDKTVAVVGITIYSKKIDVYSTIILNDRSEMDEIISALRQCAYDAWIAPKVEDGRDNPQE